MKSPSNSDKARVRIEARRMSVRVLTIIKTFRLDVASSFNQSLPHLVGLNVLLTFLSVLNLVSSIFLMVFRGRQLEKTFSS